MPSNYPVQSSEFMHSPIPFQRIPSLHLADVNARLKYLLSFTNLGEHLYTRSRMFEANKVASSIQYVIKSISRTSEISLCTFVAGWRQKKLKLTFRSMMQGCRAFFEDIIYNVRFYDFYNRKLTEHHSGLHFCRSNCNQIRCNMEWGMVGF